MIEIKIRPMSVNECWQGRRFKTPKYRKYEADCLYLLPKGLTLTPPYRLRLEFGVSNMAMDVDNPVKPFIDILQKKYKFNDKDIIELHITKIKVKKGAEYIRFARY